MSHGSHALVATGKPFAFSPENEAKFIGLLTRYPTKRAVVLPALWLAQEQEGRRNAEAAIALKEQFLSAALRLAAIVEWSEDAIIGEDPNGIVTSWNRAAERMFGHAAAEMVGQSIRRIIPADREAEEEVVLTRIRAGMQVDRIESVRIHKDGRRIDVALTVA